jgi:DNA polymerase-3 subunit epsilon
MDLRSTEFAVVDVETTGSGPNRGDRITEIAVVHVKDDAATTAFEMLLNPQRPVSPFAARLTGIHWDALHEAPTFGDVADRLLEAIDGRVFVAHNAKFDWRMLSSEVERVTGQPLKGDRLCTVKLARRLLPHLPRRNLDSLAWHYDVSIIGRHRAGGDARATARILQCMLADARRMDIDTWDHLNVFLRSPRPRPKPSAMPQPVSGEAVA